MQFLCKWESKTSFLHILNLRPEFISISTYDYKIKPFLMLQKVALFNNAWNTPWPDSFANILQKQKLLTFFAGLRMAA